MNRAALEVVREWSPLKQKRYEKLQFAPGVSQTYSVSNMKCNMKRNMKCMGLNKETKEQDILDAS
jgi:hypothetical protein